MFRRINKMWHYNITILVIIITKFSFHGYGFKQELWMHTETGYVLYFNFSFSDLSLMSPLLPITKLCARGRWRFFQKTNFTTYANLAGSRTSDEVICSNHNSKPILSLRYLAAPDTDTDAISLYSGIEWTGKDLLVTGKVMTNIEYPGMSIVATGKSAWTLFEGPNLDGKSVCFKVPREGSHFEWANKLSDEIKISEIRSVFKGCDEEELKLYKAENGLDKVSD